MKPNPVNWSSTSPRIEGNPSLGRKPRIALVGVRGFFVAVMPSLVFIGIRGLGVYTPAGLELFWELLTHGVDAVRLTY